MEPHLINDGRIIFKNITFSKYQKSKARLELIKNLYDDKIENACYWSAEFICAGHYLDLWDIILYYAYKYIHNGNPKLALYLNMRYNNFINILYSGYNENILKMRNNDKIRKLFCELICVLCYSNRKNIICEVKLDKNNSFEISSMSEKFKAPNIGYIDVILRPDDPKELIIPINELVFNLISKNIIQVCYWYEWIIEYENICIKKKRKCVCDNRMYAPNGHSHDIIWIIWDLFLHESSKRSKFIKKTMDALLTLFTLKYSTGCQKKRRNILYLAISLLCENTVSNEEILRSAQQENVSNILKKIDLICIFNLQII